MKSAAEFFKLFADPTRLRILHALGQGEFCVCELVDALQTPQYTVSRHLAGMRKSGWVTERREGTWMYYRLAPEHEALIKQLLRTAAEQALDKKTRQGDSRRLRSRLKLRQDGHCVLGYGEV